MLPRETRYSKLPGPSGAGKRAIGRTRASRIPPPSFGTGAAQPTRFAATPLRSAQPQALADDLYLIFDPSSTPMPTMSMVSTEPMQVPSQPQTALLIEGLDEFVPIAPMISTPAPVEYSSRYKTPSSVAYKVSLSSHPKIIPSFEPSAENVPDMTFLEAPPGPEPLPPCASAVRRQEYTKPPRLSAPVKMVIPMRESQPKVAPSFECSPEMAYAMLEEAPMPEETPPCASPRRLTVAAAKHTPASVKMEIPMDDRRKSKVIPSYERTPEEMLPPLEPDRPVTKKRHTISTNPRYSIGGMAWQLPFDQRPPKKSTVRHSFEGDEEPGLHWELPPFRPPELPTRVQPQRPTGFQQHRAGVPRRETIGHKPPPKPKKQPPKTDRTPEDRMVKKKPTEKAGTILQVGPELTHGDPPVACTRKITSIYYSKPPQKGATIAKVREDIVEVRGEPESAPTHKPSMLAPARQRYLGGSAASGYSRPQITEMRGVPSLPPKPLPETLALPGQRQVKKSAVSAARSQPGRKSLGIREKPLKPYKPEELAQIERSRQLWRERQKAEAGPTGSRIGALVTVRETEVEPAPAPRGRRTVSSATPASGGYKGKTYRRIQY